MLPASVCVELGPSSKQKRNKNSNLENRARAVAKVWKGDLSWRGQHPMSKRMERLRLAVARKPMAEAEARLCRVNVDVVLGAAPPDFDNHPQNVWQV